MLFVRSFALVLLLAIAALALSAAVPEPRQGKVISRAALLSTGSQPQTFAAVSPEEGCGGAACGMGTEQGGLEQAGLDKPQLGQP